MRYFDQLKFNVLMLSPPFINFVGKIKSQPSGGGGDQVENPLLSSPQNQDQADCVIDAHDNVCAFNVDGGGGGGGSGGGGGGGGGGEGGGDGGGSDIDSRNDDASFLQASTESSEDAIKVILRIRPMSKQETIDKRQM
jgi:hypothetical protein